ncbi:YwqG family protein [Streptacidiphilus griseoplanus]|uniref:YwqG family protein n=1 Tax=Peterkaempfera griseoplana TaxID=66896 RepID=UPI00099EF959|nr:YwqG family protein [Peterkaempfera griseoplana]
MTASPRPYAALAAEHLPADIAARWTELLLPCVRLLPAEAGQPVAVELGGVPRLPAGEEWPEWPGHGPLSFVAAVDCAALPREAVAQGFPGQGTLLFFYFDGQVDDGESVVFVDEPDSWAGARVLYVPAGTETAEAAVPSGLEAYPRVALAARMEVSAPDPWHPRGDAALGSPRVPGAPDDRPAHVRTFLDGLYDLRDQVGHQLGGHAHPVQNPVDHEVAHAVLGGGVPWDDPRIEAEAQRWVLLAQFDSDDAAGMMWGDCGALYL